MTEFSVTQLEVKRQKFLGLVQFTTSLYSRSFKMIRLQMVGISYLFFYTVKYVNFNINIP